MLTISIVSAILALVVGFALKWFFDKRKSQYRISWFEFAICAVVIILVEAPLISWIGWNASVQSQVTYHENWNGYELQTSVQDMRCYKDGSCRHYYDCDHYWVKVVDRQEYTEPGYTDANKVYHPPVHHPEVSHQEERHHECPYANHEYTYIVDTTLGDYTIGSHWLTANPESDRWDGYTGGDYRRHVPDSIPRGIPAFWETARQRIESGHPGPVAQRHDYENYIMASEGTILKRYSSSIDRYLEAGQLPALSRDPIRDYYFADRAFFVGTNPAGDWQASLASFNAALGTDLQGDLYLVVVDANKVTDAQDYMMALSAYWGAEQYFGKDAISKNAIMVVVGTKDGKTVDWARAQTGMPAGNVAMLSQLEQDLPGVALTPEALLGKPHAQRIYQEPEHSGYKVELNHSDGAIEKVIWGANKFERVCMSCKGEAGKLGYEYLKLELHPGPLATALIYGSTVLGSLLIWGAALYFAVPAARVVLQFIRDAIVGIWASIVGRIRNVFGKKKR